MDSEVNKWIMKTSRYVKQSLEKQDSVYVLCALALWLL